MSATAQADDAVTALRRAFDDAQSNLASWGDAATLDAAQHAVEADGPRIDRWASVHRAWAEAGQRDDGATYGWDRWYSEARDLAADLTYQVRVSVDSSALSVVAETLSATGGQLADDAVKLGNALRSPWLWAGVGVVALIGAVLWLRR